MPGIITPTLTASIGFRVSAKRLGYDSTYYFEQIDPAQRPMETIKVPVADLRQELESTNVTPVQEQLDERGFAVQVHESAALQGVADSPEALSTYLEETKELFRRELGCDRVEVWNSVMRRNGIAEDTRIKVQTTPLPERLPVTNVSGPAGSAHVDQDAVNAERISRLAVGDEAYESAKRVQIINVWRPLHGPVTNAPLAMCDFKSLSPEDAQHMPGPFGGGVQIHHSEGQTWNYIQHQMANEIIYLRCFDSLQGADGSALYGAHVACEVEGESVVEGELKPRESIEVRLVVVWN